MFVRSWRDASKFRDDPQNFISPSIDLPDGRQVPVCVVEAAPETAAWAPSPSTGDDSRCYGGGLPVFSEVQGHERFGTLGCLSLPTEPPRMRSLRLTSPPNSVSSAFRAGELKPIGKAEEKQVVRQPFQKIYPTLSGKYVDSCLDAGLIRVNSVESRLCGARHWTCRRVDPD